MKRAGDIPSGSVKHEGINIIVTAGYVESQTIELPLFDYSIDKNVVTIDEGWVDDHYEFEVPEANITETDTQVTVGVGYVPTQKVFVKNSTPDLPEVSFAAADLLVDKTAIDSTGNVISGAMPYANITEEEGLTIYDNNELTYSVIIEKGYVPERTEYKAKLSERLDTDTSITIGAGWLNKSVIISKTNTELPEVSFTAADLLIDKTAIDSDGNVVSGAMPYSQQVMYDGGSWTVEYTSGYLPNGIKKTAPAAEVEETDTQVSIGMGWVSMPITVDKGGSSGVNSYYVCTSVISDSQWNGCKIVIDNNENILYTTGGETTFTAVKNPPDPGKFYDNNAQFCVAPNAKVISIVPYENMGGQTNYPIGLKLKATVENKSDDEITYTLMNGPQWMTFEDNILSGVPTQTGNYSAEIKVETDNWMSVIVKANINVISPVGDAVFYLPLRDSQLRAATGQYLVTGRGVYNTSQYYDYLRPEFVTYDGYKCAKFVAGYTWDDETGEENSFITSVETNEFANIVDTAQRSVSFLACPQRFYSESEYGAAAIEWGETTQHKMFRMCPAYTYEYDEETGEESYKHIVAVSLWNGDVNIDTGLACDNKMHHYALTMDCTGNNAGTMKLYVDGSEVWSGWFEWGTPHTVNSPISIGKVYGNDGYNYEGYLAEVKVWNKIITASEAAAEYNRVKALQA